MGPVLCLIEGYDEQRPVVEGLDAEPLEGPHDPWKATVAGREVVVATTGVGPERAWWVAADCIARYEPDLVVSTGTCGALVDELEVEDWLVTGRVRALGSPTDDGRPELETLESPAEGRLGALRDALGASDELPRPHDGLLVTVSGEPILERAEKTAIAEAHGCVAVDMESHGIARAAADRGIDWLVARVVVDTPDRPLPELGELNAETGRPPYGGLLKYVLRHPVDGPRTLYGLWALVQDYAGHLIRVLPTLAGEKTCG